MKTTQFHARRCKRGNPLTSINLWAGVVFLLCSASLRAQDRTGERTSRFEFSPMFSYRTHMDLPIQSALQGAVTSVALAARPSYGFASGIHISEENLVEFRWNRQNSHADIQGLRVPMTLDQFYCDFNHELILQHRAPWARPFLVASIGATNIATGTNSNAIGFSAGIGAGIKFLMGRHFGLRMQIEWLPTFWNEQGAVDCGASCFIHVGGNLVSQTEIAVGPVIRF